MIQEFWAFLTKGGAKLHGHSVSKDAIAFFGNEVSSEQLAEIAPILRVWRNRKSLKDVTFSQCLQLLKFETSTVRLRMILRDDGIYQMRESCLAAWTLGILPLDKCNRPLVSATLSQFLTGKGELFSNHYSRRFGRAIIRTLKTSALMTFSVFFFYWLICLVSINFGGGITEELLLLICQFALMCGLGGIFTTLALSIPLFPIVSLIYKGVDTARLNKIRTYIALSLGRIGLPDSAESLSRASLGLNWKVASMAQISLCDLLPTITHESFGQLPSETIPNLSKLLKRVGLREDVIIENPLSAKNEVSCHQLAFAILDALEKIGDSRAIKAVIEVSGSASNRKIQKRASEILPILEERAQNENDRSMLLRGSSEPVKPNELLRPVLEKIPIETKGLLRPNYNIEEEASQMLKQG